MSHMNVFSHVCYHPQVRISSADINTSHANFSDNAVTCHNLLNGLAKAGHALQPFVSGVTDPGHDPSGRGPSILGLINVILA